MVTNTEKWALAYAANGHAVFPVKPSGKTPLTPHGFKDATVDPEQIRAWLYQHPDANLGLPTGLIFDGLDVDANKGGLESLDRLLHDLNIIMPTTPTAQTGGGGKHFLFVAHPGLKSGANVFGAKYPGLDIRAKGGYIVVAPSTHASGKPYGWLKDRGLLKLALADWPPKLLAALLDGEAAPPDDHQGEQSWLGGSTEGSRNTDLTKAVGHWIGKGLSLLEVQVLAHTKNGNNDPKLDDAEVDQVVESIWTIHQGKQGPPVAWVLHDIADEWDVPEPEMLIDKLIPLMGPFWVSGLPKTGKSLFLLYLVLALAARADFVAGKFEVLHHPKVLYVSAEDGRGRIKKRKRDILAGWDGLTPERGMVKFLAQEAVDLADPAHVERLRQICLDEGRTILVLDTWTACSPTSDPLGTEAQSRLAQAIRTLAIAINGLVIVVDHTRKNRPDGAEPGPSDVFGPSQKWQVADHVLMLTQTDDGLVLQFTGKDFETQQHVLRVSPEGSGVDKFTYLGTPEELAEERKAKRYGEQVEISIVDAVAAATGPMTAGEILAQTKWNMKLDTFQRKCKVLVLAKKIANGLNRMDGKVRTATYVRTENGRTDGPPPVRNEEAS